MSVRIRLHRMGKKKQPFYRIVAVDKRKARDGKFLENLGQYVPITQPAKILVKEDRLTHWLDKGAQPSDTVSSLLTQIGFLEKYDKASKGQDVSGMELKTTITERRKKTRKVKKAAVAAAEAAKTEAADTAKAAEEAKAAKAEKPAEAPAAEAKEEEAKDEESKE